MNRNCATICLKESPTKPAAYYLNKMGPIDGPDSSDFWACFEVCCVLFAYLICHHGNFTNFSRKRTAVKLHTRLRT